MSFLCSWLLVLVAAWDPDFTAWCDRYGRTYEAEERQQRLAIFRKNRAFIAAHNSGDRTYELGLNEFSDLTAEEFRAHYLGYNGRGTMAGSNLGTHAPAEDPPKSIDWREKGAVTPVKNQGQCGSCWAFSSTGALEGAWQIATGKLASISEQQLVDCAKFIPYFNLGCNGGQQKGAFWYAERHAMCTEDSYPYTAKSGLFAKCKADGCTEAVPEHLVTGYKIVNSSADALMSAAAQQPVAVAIEADTDIFQHYKSGVVTDSGCGSTLDHAVLVVGYGTDGGTDYWIVKNSWGADWGEKGYVRLVRGQNECGILNGPPLYPVVEKPAILV